jgi:UDP-N-acetylmuramoyl-tripeptide--D-alanyl-D-alanine ligase
MIPLSLDEIATVVGGTVAGDGSVKVTAPAVLGGREAEPGGLFVAVAGELTGEALHLDRTSRAIEPSRGRAHACGHRLGSHTSCPDADLQPVGQGSEEAAEYVAVVRDICRDGRSSAQSWIRSAVAA